MGRLAYPNGQMLLLLLGLYAALLFLLIPDVLSRLPLGASPAWVTPLALLVLVWTALEIVLALAAWLGRAFWRKPRMSSHPAALPLNLLLAGVVAVAVFALGRHSENALRYDALNALGYATLMLGGLLSLRSVKLSLQTLASPAMFAAGATPRPAPVRAAPTPSWTFGRLEALSGRAFEELVAWLYQQEGQEARLTPASRDGGWDVEVIQGTRRSLVECKVMPTVGVEVLRGLHSVVISHRASGGIVVTTGRFTSDAVNEASRLGLELVSGGELLVRLNALAQAGRR